jgi:endonuclease-3 related protein
MNLLATYKRLYKHYGPQDWWPAETAFEVMVGAILTQNTAWSNVELAIANLKQHKALDAESILRVSDSRLGSWLRPSGYFNIKSRRLKNLCRWYLDYGGHETLAQLDTETLRHTLLAVNGVGPETADDILLYAFARPVFVIDAYTRRIFTRLGLIEESLGYEALRGMFEQDLLQTRKRGRRRQGTLVRLYNEYHALIVVHGKEICRPRPLCKNCCLAAQCRYNIQ